jgi:hypothetical protein
MALAGAVLEHREARHAFFADKHWMAWFEGLLTRCAVGVKAGGALARATVTSACCMSQQQLRPSTTRCVLLCRKLLTHDDFADWLPVMPSDPVHPGGTPPAAGRASSFSAEANLAQFQLDMQQLTASMAALEAAHMRMAAAALLEDWAPDAGGAAASMAAAAADAEAGRMAALVCQLEVPLLAFVRHMLAKNRDIAAHSRPPGLSDPTVLTSAYFLLVGLVQPYLDGAREAPSLGSFPAGPLFVQGRSTTAALPAEVRWRWDCRLHAVQGLLPVQEIAGNVCAFGRLVLSADAIASRHASCICRHAAQPTV